MISLSKNNMKTIYVNSDLYELNVYLTYVYICIHGNFTYYLGNSIQFKEATPDISNLTKKGGETQ